MTGEFDLIGALFSKYEDRLLSDEEVAKFEQLLVEAIEQASRRKPSKWNFQLWIRNGWRGQTEEEIDHFFGQKNAAKYEFLSDTHSFLDHDDTWHHRVFNRAFLDKLYRFRDDLRDVHGRDFLW